MKTTMIPPSELIINDDGSIFHLHLRPEQLADRIILVGDPARVTMIGEYLDEKECDVRSREFHTITGRYHGKRITVVSHGIGGDNIDIVLNELDALANIDLATRTVKPDFRQLTMVRIGTSGGTYVAAGRAIGFDGVIYFYDQTEQIRDTTFEKELLRQLDWTIDGLRPYVVPADPSLLEQITLDDIQRGITIAANGFYGEPGVHSARYDEHTDHDSEANMRKLLRKLGDTTNRKAHFRTVVSLIIDGKEHQFEGRVEGYIATEKSGTEGFGYDPIFIPEGYDKSFAELGEDVKNQISHRARAVRKLAEYLKQL